MLTVASPHRQKPRAGNGEKPAVQTAAAFSQVCCAYVTALIKHPLDAREVK